MNNIGVNFGANIARMNFLNCTIDVPLRYGGQCIASGCGSGKTTVIKEIIRQKWDEGILYTAATIKECDEMRDWIFNNLVGTNLKGKTLYEDDIIVIHSKDENGMEILLDNPELISSKLIIICTHYKFLHEYPEILLKNSFNIMHWSNPQTGIRRSVTRTMNNGTEYKLPRQYILIDELPTCDILKSKIEKPLMAILMNRELVNIIKETTPDGREIIRSADSSYSRYPEFKLMENAYNEQAKGTSLSLRPDTGKPIDEFRTKMPLEALYENFDIYNPNNEVKDITVKYNITDLILGNIDTRFWLFDGTGDLTYGGSSKFNVRSVNKKYSSPIKFIKIPIMSGRYIKGSYIVDNENDLINELNNNCEELIKIIEKNQKTLIITWKNLKIKDSNYRKNASIKLTIKENNKEFNLSQYYTYNICKKLNIPVSDEIPTSHIEYNDKEFSIIHYQSGLDRATNEFRDYDTVVFYGEFIVPNTVVSEFNELNESNTNLLKYTTYQLVQSVCRTRIRNHKGESINIYFSEDWDEKYMQFLNMYLTNNIEWVINSNGVTNGLYYINSECQIKIDDLTLNKIKPKWRNIVKKLGDYDNNIIESLNNCKKYDFIIDMEDIDKILHFNDRKVSRYYPLINYLRLFGINMTIRTIRNKNKI